MSRAIYLIIFIAIFTMACDGTVEQALDAIQDENAPVLASIGNKTVTIGQTLSFTVTATDPNGLDLTYAADGSVSSGLDPLTETATRADFNTGTGEFSWDTTGVSSGVYRIDFSVMNAASLTDNEIISITVSSTTPAPTQFEQGQTLYNTDCSRSGCHRNEDTNEGNLPILCTPATVIKTETENPPGSMPTFNLSEDEEEAIANYLLNVKPNDC